MVSSFHWYNNIVLPLFRSQITISDIECSPIFSRSNSISQHAERAFLNTMATISIGIQRPVAIPIGDVPIRNDWNVGLNWWSRETIRSSLPAIYTIMSRWNDWFMVWAMLYENCINIQIRWILLRMWGLMTVLSSHTHTQCYKMYKTNKPKNQIVQFETSGFTHFFFIYMLINYCKSWSHMDISYKVFAMRLSWWRSYSKIVISFIDL